MLFVIYIVFQMRHFPLKTSGKHDVIQGATLQFETVELRCKQKSEAHICWLEGETHPLLSDMKT